MAKLDGAGKVMGSIKRAVRCLLLLLVVLMGFMLGCSEDRAKSSSGEATASPAAQAGTVGESPAGADAPKVGSGVGDQAPTFSLSLTDGSRVTSDGLLRESRPVFLFFFATW